MDEKVLNILQNIEKRLTDLEKNMNELSKKTVHSFHLDIKNVQTLNLDELSYYLEHIDVKELSGTLNIGNKLILDASLRVRLIRIYKEKPSS